MKQQRFLFRWVVRFVPVFVLVAALMLPRSAQAAGSWKAGVASVTVTPQDSLWMAGYASRNKPAEGAEQELYAKALALQDEAGTRLVVITMDLIGVPRPLREALEKRVGERYGLPPSGLLINASHTHCGPELRTSRFARDEDDARLKAAEAYYDWLEDRLTGLIGEALKDLAPSKLLYSRARCGFAMNRRLPTERGFINSPNPDGPVDHDVPVLQVKDAEGALRAVLFGYACHNTTLGIYKWCGDYAGFAQQYFERDHPNVTALFMTGCGGDQNPYPRRTLDLAQRHGRSLATAVEAAIEANPQTVDGPLSTALEDVALDYATPPTRGELKERRQSGNKYERAYAEALLAELDEKGTLEKRYPYPVQVIRFGNDLSLVGLGGETVVDYSLRLKRELPGAVWVAGYCNDVMSYIPSLRVLKEGGYEGGTSMRYFRTTLHPGPWAESIEERIVGKVKELMAGAE